MSETSCDPKDVALAALTNLVRLMGAELVAGRHRDDVDLLDQAVRAKIGAVTVLGCPDEVVAAGLTLARSHVELALTQIRTQAASAQRPALVNVVTQEQLPTSTAAEPRLH